MKQTASLWLFTYWNELRRGRKAPNRFEVDPMKIGPLLPETFILETGSNPQDCRFRLAGTRLCEAYGHDLKGRDFLSFWKERNDHEAIASLLMTISEDGSAGLLEMTAINQNRESCKFEILLLPLVHSGGRVNRIMGCMSAISEPSWLGSKPLIAQKLDDLELIWPDAKPKFAMAGDENLAVIPSGQGRIVTAKGRLFRVVEGGRKD